MNAWRDQLEAWGAIRDPDGNVAHFGTPTDELRDVLTASTLTVTERSRRIRVSGKDHREFLQAQLTSNVLGLDAEQTQTSAWLTPKGQVRCVLDLLGGEAWVDLIMPADRIDALLKTLSMFVLRAKVIFTEMTPDEPMLGLAGPGADAVATTRVGELAEGQAAISTSGTTYWRLRGRLPRFLLTGTLEAITAERAALSDVPLAGNSAWHLAGLEAGIPSLTSETAERYIPQMLNLDELDAISFDKGCYPGQEIVARTRYLGRLKRRLYRGQVTGEAPSILSGLRAQDGGREKQGEIVDCAPTHQPHTWKVLSVANIMLGSTTVDLGETEPASEVVLDPVAHGSSSV